MIRFIDILMIFFGLLMALALYGLSVWMISIGEGRLSIGGFIWGSAMALISLRIWRNCLIENRKKQSDVIPPRDANIQPRA